MTDINTTGTAIASCVSDITSMLHDTVIAAEEWLEKTKSNKSVKVAEVAVSLFALKEAHNKLDEVVKRLYHVHNTLDKNVLPERLNEADMDMIRVPEIARSFSLRANPSRASFATPG